MPYTFSCPRCGEQFTFQDEWGGQEAICPCGHLFDAPGGPIGRTNESRDAVHARLDDFDNAARGRPVRDDAQGTSPSSTSHGKRSSRELATSAISGQSAPRAAHFTPPFSLETNVGRQWLALFAVAAVYGVVQMTSAFSGNAYWLIEMGWRTFAPDVPAWKTAWDAGAAVLHPAAVLYWVFALLRLARGRPGGMVHLRLCCLLFVVISILAATVGITVSFQWQAEFAESVERLRLSEEIVFAVGPAPKYSELVKNCVLKLCRLVFFDVGFPVGILVWASRLARMRK